METEISIERAIAAAERDATESSARSPILAASTFMSPRVRPTRSLSCCFILLTHRSPRPRSETPPPPADPLLSRLPSPLGVTPVSSQRILAPRVYRASASLSRKLLKKNPCKLIFAQWGPQVGATSGGAREKKNFNAAQRL